MKNKAQFLLQFSQIPSLRTNKQQIVQGNIGKLILTSFSSYTFAGWNELCERL